MDGSFGYQTSFLISIMIMAKFVVKSKQTDVHEELKKKIER